MSVRSSVKCGDGCRLNYGATGGLDAVLPADYDAVVLPGQIFSGQNVSFWLDVHPCTAFLPSPAPISTEGESRAMKDEVVDGNDSPRGHESVTKSVCAPPSSSSVISHRAVVNSKVAPSASRAAANSESSKLHEAGVCNVLSLDSGQMTFRWWAS